MSHTVGHDFDPHAHRRGYLAGTDYALPYLSRFSRANAPDAAVLRHANCGYLSTPGVPPTLLALKQHAQSLCCLIAMLEPHAHDISAAVQVTARPRLRPSEAKTAKTRALETLEAASKAKAKAKAAEDSTRSTDESLLEAAAHPTPAGADLVADNPFDWLSDLATPYTNDDPDHHRPLYDLLNEVRTHHDVLGTTFHCPLETHRARGRAPYRRPGDAGAEAGGEGSRGGGSRAREIELARAGVNITSSHAAAAANSEDEDDDDGTAAAALLHRHPHASHHNLLMHANMCLERLDHEFGATGGLLSLLPAALFPEGEQGAGSSGTDSTPAAAFTAEEQDAARNSLVGQWLSFTQQLVGRMHELEVAYGSALDALRGEAELPLELVDATDSVGNGAAGGAGAAAAAALVGAAAAAVAGTAAAGTAAAGTAAAGNPPLASVADFASQDRWILTNAGEDVWSFLHGMLDQQGRVEDTRAAVWAKQGVISRRSTVQDRLLYVDVNTRYYRVTAADGAADGTNVQADSGGLPPRGPLFVCPAWDKHPALQPAAAERENRPTVVMVPFATASSAAAATNSAAAAAAAAASAASVASAASGANPASSAAAAAAAAAASPASHHHPPAAVVRVSTLEHRYSAQLRAAGELAQSHARLAQQTQQLHKANERLVAQAERRQEEMDLLEDKLGTVTAELQELQRVASGGDSGAGGAAAGAAARAGRGGGQQRRGHGR